MSKRAADRQITQDTLDQDDEPEDAGRFEKASQSELEGRVFKKARRTLPAETSTDQSGSGRGLFSGIKLTGSLTQQNGVSSLTQKPFLSALQPSSTSNPLSGLVFKKTSPPPSFTSAVIGTSSTPSTAPKVTFLSELRNLNTSVNDWIGKHVRENPYVDLTPIFRDYEKHLRELDNKFQNHDHTTKQKGDGGPEVTSSDTSEPEAMNSRATSQSDSEKEREGGGGEGCEEVKEDGDKKLLKTPAADEEEREAMFSVRAKLFFKKSSDSEFTELGIGQMRVLPGSGESVRAIMRNDTALAKVLLNVRVTNAVPITSKNNNIFLVCVPNPPLEKAKDDDDDKANVPSTVTYLIRVKTVTMATGLLQALQGSAHTNTESQ